MMIIRASIYENAFILKLTLRLAPKIATMKTQGQILDVLRENQNLETEAEAKKFLAAVEQLETESNLLPDLLYLFSDNVQYSDPLKYLANFIATLDDSLIIPNLVKVSPNMVAKAKDWLEVFFMAATATKKGRNSLILALNNATDIERNLVLGLFEEILSTLDDTDEVESEIKNNLLSVKRKVQP
jgi:hypothetical protein